MSVKPEAAVRNIAEIMWQTPPAHYDAHSSMLMTPPTRTGGSSAMRARWTPAAARCRGGTPAATT